MTVKHGVPHCSVLIPLLFIIYLFQYMNLIVCVSFADDITIIKKIKNIKSVNPRSINEVV